MDEVLPRVPIRQWVLSLPFALRYLLATRRVKAAADSRVRFVPVPGPSAAELQALVQTIAERIGRSLERAGLITRDIENR